MLAFHVPAQGVDLSEAQLRDGLSRLAALLALDVPKNARWVLVSSERGRFGIFSQEEDVLNTEGNAFLFDEKPGVEARVMVMYDGGIYPVKAMQDGGDEDARQMQREFRATWKNADAAKDAATAAEWLQKEAKKAGAMQGLLSGSDPFGRGDEAGAQFAASQQSALLWAAMLLHTGQDASALSLATAALAGTDEAARKQVLDAFFNRLGDQAYGKIMQDFAKHRDWAKLSTALDELVKKFPLGWQRRDAVRVFHHHATERAKLPAAPPLKTKGTLSADDQKTLLDWLKELEAGNQSPFHIWTLPPLVLEEDVESRSNEMETAFPRSVGLAAVPLLAALLADDTLTLVGLDGRGGGFQQHFFGGGQDKTERLRNSYQSLQKPPTRAHLAWSVLERVLPQDLRRSDLADFAEAIPDILAWHASVKDAAPADLALAYIESGQNDETVLAHAIATDDPKKLVRLEGAMLEGVNIWDLNGLEPFVTKLGPQRGPSFLTKVRQKLEGDLSRYQNDASQQERQRKQMESALKRLEAAAKGEKKTPDLKALLAVFAAFDPEAEDADQVAIREAYEDFPKATKKLSAPARVETVVNALPDFKSPKFAARMLSFAFQGDGGKSLEITPEERQPLLEATKTSWKRLLEAGNGEEDQDERDGMLMRVVGHLEEITQGEVNFRALNQFATLGVRGTQVLRERGTALLAGQKPAALPDPAAIKPEQRQQLLAEWGGKSSEEITRGLATLEIDKVLALNEIVQRGTDLPERFKTHITLIQEVRLEKVTDAAPWQAWKGKPLDQASVTALAQQLSAYTGTGMLTVHARRSAPLFGFTLVVSEATQPGSGWQTHYLRNFVNSLDEDLPKTTKRLSVGFFQQERLQENWSWFDAPVTEEPKDAQNQGDTPERLKEMNQQAVKSWQKVFSTLAGGKTAHTILFFVSAPPAMLQSKE
ncbi:MAG TPA: hypothetical protein DDZ88_04520 [Verrucomicrobiales bacterium]|nr:hypothetical protein [Verrucomicrobiales bacterium]